MARPVAKDPLWVLESLWHARRDVRCQVPLVDTILVKDGVASRWMFTSPASGEVLKKHTTDSSVVHDAFARSPSVDAKGNKHHYVAMARTSDSVRLITAAKWASFCKQFEANIISLAAVQAYIHPPGNSGTVYRNEYSLSNQEGVVVRRTFKQPGVLLDAGEGGTSLPDGVPSHESSINHIMNDYTQALVRYVEGIRRCRVAHITVEYVLHSHSGGSQPTPFVTWVRDVQVFLGDAARDLRLTALRSAGTRNTQAGNHNAMLAEGERPVSRARSPARRARSPELHSGLLQKTPKESVTQVMLDSATSHLHSLGGEKVKKSMRERRSAARRGSIAAGSIASDEFGLAKDPIGVGKASAKRNYPTPFRCYGDYCQFHVQAPGALREVSALDIARQFFNDQELMVLGSRLEVQGVDTSGDREQLFSVTYKTIAQARDDHARVAAASVNVVPGLGEELEADREGEATLTSGLTRETEARRQQRTWSKQRGEVFKLGPSNYYKQVKVCTACFKVYATLDRARDILRAEKARKAKGKRGTRLRTSSSHSQRRLRGPGGGAEGGLGTSGRLNEVANARPQRSGRRKRGPPRSPLRAASAGVGGEWSGPGLEASPPRQMSQTMGHGGDSQPAAKRERRGRRHKVKKGWGTKHVGIKEKVRMQKEHQAKIDSFFVDDGQAGAEGAAQQEAGRRSSRKGKEVKHGRRAKTPGINVRKDTKDARFMKGSRLANSTSAPDKFGSYVKLEEYLKLRPKGDSDPEEVVPEQPDFSYLLKGPMGDGWRGRVLLADADLELAHDIVEMLVEEGYAVTVAADGTTALKLSRGGGFDVVLLERDLPALSGVEVTRITRQREAGMTPGQKKQFRLPIIALTGKSEPDDLQLYMEIGMDGCVSKPVMRKSLLSTVAAAVPAPPEPAAVVLDTLYDDGGDANNGTGQRSLTQGKQARIFKKTKKNRNRVPGTTQLSRSMPQLPKHHNRDSVEAAAAGIVMPIADTNDITSGVYQMDADTSMPYTILGRARAEAPLFHFVICQDLFDTCETYQIFFKSIVSKYPGLQVLVWNYPGQAFTEWRREQVLNNVYVSQCLKGLMEFLGPAGTNEFSMENYSAPFYLLGFGHGASAAVHYAAHYAPPNLRALVLANAFMELDPHLAGVLHDCMNVFSCSPDTRPDLPVYFFSRFLFSPGYLKKVGAPLALNLYTAVHNPISLEGRIQLCKGALGNVSIKEWLKDLPLPILAVAGTHDGFVLPQQVKVLTGLRGGEERSIKKCLHNRRAPCVIWLRAGHEVFQECRRPLTNLFEQLATGYHERNDVRFLPLLSDSAAAAATAGGTMRGAGGFTGSSSTAARVAARARERAGQLHETAASRQRAERYAASGPAGGSSTNGGKLTQLFEDKFLDNVVGTLNKTRAQGTGPRNPFTATGTVDFGQGQGQSYAQGGATMATTEGARDYPAALDSVPPDPPGYTRGYNKMRGTGDRTGTLRSTGKGGTGHSVNPDGTMSDNMLLNPGTALFERRENAVYKVGKGSKIYPTDVPEVKEYMGWRVRRNKKRLQRLETAASVMQKAWRAYVARTLVQRMREQRSSLIIQRNYRGVLGRRRFAWRKKEDWAIRLVQRQFRGHMGRRMYANIRTEEGAARHIQRIFRGKLDRRRVNRIKESRRKAALRIQTLYRARRARLTAWKRRDERNAAISIQRVYRGSQGRKRATRERDRYLFAKSQSQGIEFGRQMLMEHKLHGTKLQSEVTLLTKEKLATEERVEGLLLEIAAFEDGVRALEKEMTDLSKAEAEAVGTLDEAGKVELRENKMRLDREFGSMLVKIADRRETLKALESKLQTIEKTRQVKKEELRDLERKLVVLLEEQQRELHNIKQRQERRQERAIPDAVAIANGAAGSGPGGVGGVGGGAMVPAGAGGKGTMVVAGDGGGAGGPTPQQRAEANALMASTETMMKFGFMSMSLTYFSSLNMIKAMRQVGAANAIMANPLVTAMAGGGMMPGGAGMMGPGGVPQLAQPVPPTKHFKPGLKPGQLPGQEPRDVALWTVNDVGKWLETLELGQYREVFKDAAVDGAFLYDLVDADLRNTLGIEHQLHRKKIINAVRRLRHTEVSRGAGAVAVPQQQLVQQPLAAQRQPLAAVAQQQAAALVPAGVGSGAGAGVAAAPAVASAGLTAAEDAAAQAATQAAQASGIQLKDIISWIRHGKNKKVAEALSVLPDRPFDASIVVAPFVDGFGTQYEDRVARMAFHIDKSDDYGNSMLITGCQNGNIKASKLLIRKGANPNHQNNQGQTPLHFAMSYNFYELGSWLADPDGGGADDSIENKEGLGPYDGLG